LAYCRGKDIKSKIQNNLNRKIVHIKIKADEAGMEAVLSKPAESRLAQTQKVVDIGKQAALPTGVPPQDRKFKLRSKPQDAE
jgi:hypothetical protein